MVDPFSLMQSDASSGTPEIEREREREIIRESDRRIKASSLDIMPKSFYRETEREKKNLKRKKFWLLGFLSNLFLSREL